MTTCKNCSNTFEGKFCPECGQKETHRLTVPHLGHEIFHAVTHTDKGIFFLIREMFLRPGITVREYVDGKRKRYFNPFTFLLLMMALQVFVIRKTDYYRVFNDTIAEATVSLIQSTGKTREQALQATKTVNEENQSTMEKVVDNNKLLTFLFLPLLALLSWLFFRKSRFNYAENLVFHILIAAESTLIFLVVAILPFLFNQTLGSWMLFVHLLVTMVYTFIGYRQLFGGGWGMIILKGIIIQILYMVSSIWLSKLVFYFF
jgi:hypothetical protein